MELPPGYSTKGELVCKLKKSLYGLKQTSRKWNDKLTSTIYKYSYMRLVVDHSMFFKKTNTSITFLLVYVDDIIIGGNDSKKIDLLKSYLKTHFKLKDLGELKYVLRIEIA